MGGKTKDTKEPKHWSSKAVECVVVFTGGGEATTIKLKGGSDAGQFCQVDEVGGSKSKYQYQSGSGKLHSDDVLIEVQDKKVTGYTREDLSELIKEAGKDKNPVRFRAVKGGLLEKDLRLFLTSRFQKGSFDHELQMTIRDNLYQRTVPCTTRSPRPGEVQGVDYTFLTQEEFNFLEKSGTLLESGLFDGNHYGTPRPPKEGVKAFRMREELAKAAAAAAAENGSSAAGGAPSAPEPQSAESKRKRNRSSIAATTEGTLGEEEEGKRAAELGPPDDSSREGWGRAESIKQPTSDGPERDLGPLPAHWEMAHTPEGHVYFIDHTSEMTHWLDPRLNKDVKQPSSPTTTDLPYGWERMEDPQYGVYYIDHLNRKTQYENPNSLFNENAPRALDGDEHGGHMGDQPPPFEASSEQGRRVLFVRDPEQLRGERHVTTLVKSPTGFGFAFVGGDDPDEEFLQIKNIVANGTADRDGTLRIGDVIVALNGEIVLGYTHRRAVEIFQGIDFGDRLHVQVCRGYPLCLDLADPLTQLITTVAVSKPETTSNPAQPLASSSSMGGPRDERAREMVAPGAGPAPGGKPPSLTGSAPQRLPSTGAEGDNASLNDFADALLEDAGPASPQGTLGSGVNGFTVEVNSGGLGDQSANSPTIYVVDIVRGNEGFGFKIANSQWGQRVKQVIDRPRCRGLEEGDVLIEIDGTDVRSSSHADVVRALTRCPSGGSARIVVERASWIPPVNPAQTENNKPAFNGNYQDIGGDSDGDVPPPLPSKSKLDPYDHPQMPTAPAPIPPSFQNNGISPDRHVKAQVSMAAKPAPVASNTGSHLPTSVAADTNLNLRYNPPDGFGNNNGPVPSTSNFNHNNMPGPSAGQQVNGNVYPVGTAPVLPPTRRSESHYDIPSRYRDRPTGAAIFDNALAGRAPALGAPNGNYSNYGEINLLRPAKSVGNDLSSAVNASNGQDFGYPQQFPAGNQSQPAQQARGRPEQRRSRTPGPDMYRSAAELGQNALVNERQRSKTPTPGDHRSRAHQMHAGNFGGRQGYGSGGANPDFVPLSGLGSNQPGGVANRDLDRFGGRPGACQGQGQNMPYGNFLPGNGSYPGRQSNPLGTSNVQQPQPFSSQSRPYGGEGMERGSGSQMSPLQQQITPGLAPGPGPAPGPAPGPDMREQLVHSEVLLYPDGSSGFGFRIVGGPEEDTQVGIGKIVPDGAADKQGQLCSGDEIVSVDGVSTLGMEHQHVVSLVSSGNERGKVYLGIRRRILVQDYRPPKTGLPSEQPCTISLSRPENEGFGFIIGSTPASGITIGQLIANSPAGRCGRLKVGDRVLAVNNIDVSALRHEDTVSIIKDSGLNVTLTVSPALLSNGVEEATNDIHVIELLRDSRGFGFSIRGGQEFNNMPLFVLRMAENGAAATDGRMMVGDELLEINNRRTSGMTHAEAINLISSGGSSVRLVLRRTGKVPSVLEQQSPSSSGVSSPSMRPGVNSGLGQGQRQAPGNQTHHHIGQNSPGISGFPSQSGVPSLHGRYPGGGTNGLRNDQPDAKAVGYPINNPSGVGYPRPNEPQQPISNQSGAGYPRPNEPQQPVNNQSGIGYPQPNEPQQPVNNQSGVGYPRPNEPQQPIGGPRMTSSVSAYRQHPEGDEGQRRKLDRRLSEPKDYRAVTDRVKELRLREEGGAVNSAPNRGQAQGQFRGQGDGVGLNDPRYGGGGQPSQQGGYSGDDRRQFSPRQQAQPQQPYGRSQPQLPAYNQQQAPQSTGFNNQGGPPQSSGFKNQGGPPQSSGFNNAGPPQSGGFNSQGVPARSHHSAGQLPTTAQPHYERQGIPMSRQQQPFSGGSSQITLKPSYGSGQPGPSGLGQTGNQMGGNQPRQQQQQPYSRNTSAPQMGQSSAPPSTVSSQLPVKNPAINYYKAHVNNNSIDTNGADNGKGVVLKPAFNSGSVMSSGQYPRQQQVQPQNDYSDGGRRGPGIQPSGRPGGVQPPTGGVQPPTGGMQYPTGGPVNGGFPGSNSYGMPTQSGGPMGGAGNRYSGTNAMPVNVTGNRGGGYDRGPGYR